MFYHVSCSLDLDISGLSNLLQRILPDRNTHWCYQTVGKHHIQNNRDHLMIKEQLW